MSEITTFEGLLIVAIVWLTYFIGKTHGRREVMAETVVRFKKLEAAERQRASEGGTIQ